MSAGYTTTYPTAYGSVGQQYATGAATAASTYPSYTVTQPVQETVTTQPATTYQSSSFLPTSTSMVAYAPQQQVQLYSSADQQVVPQTTTTTVTSAGQRASATSYPAAYGSVGQQYATATQYATGTQYIAAPATQYATGTQYTAAPVTQYATTTVAPSAPTTAYQSYTAAPTTSYTTGEPVSYATTGANYATTGYTSAASAYPSYMVQPVQETVTTQPTTTYQSSSVVPTISTAYAPQQQLQVYPSADQQAVQQYAVQQPVQQPMQHTAQPVVHTKKKKGCC